MPGSSERYDRDFEQVAHYQRYPAMRPWVGNDYGRYHRRLLLVAESHYLPDGSIVQQNPTTWYAGYQNRLSQEEVDYINTRAVLLAHHREPGIWDALAQVMRERGIVPPPNSNNVYDHFCWYNYFQRPAEAPYASITVQDIDESKAREVFLANLDILQPEVVIFTSSMAWDARPNLRGRPEIHDFVPHPTCRWWYREAKRYSLGRGALTGREKFAELLDLHHVRRI